MRVVARPKSDIQERIVAAAQQRFVAEGVEAASLRNIAKDAETSIGMVYYYYTTKDELFLAVVEETYRIVLADLEQRLGVGDSFAAKIRGLYQKIGELSEHELEIITLIVRESLTSGERRKRLRRRFLQGHVSLLFSVVEQGMKSGELDRDINPLLAMGCALGIGGVPSFIVRLIRAESARVSEDEEVPVAMRWAARALHQQIPDSDALAGILSNLTLRALGNRSSGRA